MARVRNLALIALLALPGAALADFSFDQGSFGAAPPASAPASGGGSGSGGGDGFGGSFDSSAGSAGAASGGSGFGGSFDAAQPGPPATPAVPTPQPPENTPAAPAPDYPAIDPQIQAFELRDMGIEPTQSLRQDQFHAPTPTALPGGFLVSTQGLIDALNGGIDLVLIDALGGQYSLPDAYQAAAMSSPGTYQDRTQQQVEQWLGQITGGDAGVPLIIYCSDPMCWLSYNASLRAIAAGYTNVYWYRGGLQAWQMAGLPLQPAGF